MTSRAPQPGRVERHVRLRRDAGDLLVRVSDVASVEMRRGDDFDDEPSVRLALEDGTTLDGRALEFVDVDAGAALAVSPYLGGFATAHGIDSFVRDADHFVPRRARTSAPTPPHGATP